MSIIPHIMNQKDFYQQNKNSFMWYSFLQRSYKSYKHDIAVFLT